MYLFISSVYFEPQDFDKLVFTVESY